MLSRPFYCAASTAALLRAHQLCSLSSHRPVQERASKRAEEAGASQESSTALQDCSSVWNSASPPLLSKEIDHFRPSFHQKIACGAPKNASSPCLTLVVGAARPESATPFQTIIPVSHEGESPSRVRQGFAHFLGTAYCYTWHCLSGGATCLQRV